MEINFNPMRDKLRFESISDNLISNNIDKIISEGIEEDYGYPYPEEIRRCRALYAFLCRVYHETREVNITVPYSKIERNVFWIWRDPMHLSDLIKVLERVGLIEVKRNPPRTNVYIIKHPVEALDYYRANKFWTDRYTAWP